MAYEPLVGVNVIDEVGYARYRAAMLPLLHAVGGSFRFDCTVERVLKSDAAHPINRVFVLSFPDRATSDSFFSDERYLEVRNRHFESSVQGVTVFGQLG